MDEKIWVSFYVDVNDSEYSYKQTKKGNADWKIEVSRKVLEKLKLDGILETLLAEALLEFDKPKDTDEEEN